MDPGEATTALEFFLRDLALAWKNLATYPAGHPALAGSVERALARLRPLLAATGELRLGVVAGGLRWADCRLESLAAQRLAETLHRRQVGVLAFHDGLTVAELDRFLRLLPNDARGAARARLDEELVAAGITGVRAEPIDYSALRLTDANDPMTLIAEVAEPATAETLQERIVRELLEGRSLGSGGILPTGGAHGDMARLVERLLLAMSPGGGTGETGEADGTPGAGGAGGVPGGGSAADGASSAATAAGLAGAGAGGAGAGSSPPAAGASGPGDPAAPAAGDASDGPAGGSGPGGAGPSPGPGGGDPGPGAAGGSRTAAAIAVALSRLVSQSLSDRRDARRGESLGQLASLLRALPAELRAPVLEAAIASLAGVDGDADALRQLAAALPATEVLRAFRQLAEQRFRFSPLAVRVAQALAAAAREEGRDRQRAGDTGAVTAALHSLFADDDVDRFGAGGERSATARALPRVLLPESPPPELGDLRETLAPEAVDRQLTVTLLELLANPLARREGIEAVLDQLRRLFRQAVEDGRPRAANEILERQQELVAAPTLDEESRLAIRRSLELLATRETVMALVGTLGSMTPGTIEQARALVTRLGGAAVRHLLAGLVDERDRSRRHHQLEFVCSLGPAVATEAVALLADPRWFVVRNALVILRRIADRSGLDAMRRCAEHPDIRVRVEAIRTLFAFENEMPRQLLERALRDPDPKAADAAITLAARRGFLEAVDPLVSLLLPWDPFARRRALRLRAWWALGQIGDARALERLRRFFTPGLVKKDALEERRAAFRALSGYDPRDRARWVELGLRSRDAAIRATCQRLAAEPGASVAPGEEPDHD